MFSYVSVEKIVYGRQKAIIIPLTNSRFFFDSFFLQSIHFDKSVFVLNARTFWSPEVW